MVKERNCYLQTMHHHPLLGEPACQKNISSGEEIIKKNSKEHIAGGNNPEDKRINWMLNCPISCQFNSILSPEIQQVPVASPKTEVPKLSEPSKFWEKQNHHWPSSSTLSPAQGKHFLSTARVFFLNIRCTLHWYSQKNPHISSKASLTGWAEL